MRRLLGGVFVPWLEGQTSVAATHLERLECFLDRQVGALGDLSDRRRPAQRRGQFVDHRADRRVQVLASAWHVHRPGLVAKMPAQLAHDRRHRECAEHHPASRVEPIDGLDQANQSRLDQVVPGLPSVREPGRTVFGQPGEILDQRVANRALPGGS
jgi:hypothetical protein